jgi:hypothetical protein
MPLGAGWELPAQPSVQMRWKRDLPGQTPTSRTPSRERTIQRQVLLALVALATVGVVGLAFSARLLVDRTLPLSVRGVWRTDGERYAQRLFELAGSRLAFQVSDSGAAVHSITRVRRSDTEAGTLYQVEYRDQGQTYEFSFVYWAGPPEEIRFPHQPFMVWTRVTDRRTLLPELF